MIACQRSFPTYYPRAWANHLPTLGWLLSPRSNRQSAILNMKHCPECGSSFPDTDEFCERDGATLVAKSSDTSRKALVALAVAVVALALGVVLFVLYQRLTNERAAGSSQSSSNYPLTPQVVSPPPPLLSSPSVSASPSPSPSPSPTPTPTPTPAVKAEHARVAMSTGPVATNVDAANKRGPVTIRLTDGTTIEADEVWETAEGIWYRRRGLVTLLKRDQVKALENPKPSPSPKSSPIPSP